MKKYFVGLVVLLMAVNVWAALAPSDRMGRDREVMLNYVETHPEVKASLKKIDCPSAEGRYVIHYGDGGQVVFKRGRKSKLFFIIPMPGPQPGLKVKTVIPPKGSDKPKYVPVSNGY